MTLRHAAPLFLAIVLGACTTSGSRTDVRSYPAPEPSRPATACVDCGWIERIEIIERPRPSTGTGAVLGGIVGGIAGNQVGKGDGRRAATVAGAAAGAVAGNAIERRTASRLYRITVRMDDGRRWTVERDRLPAGMREGQPVRVEGDRLLLR